MRRDQVSHLRRRRLLKQRLLLGEGVHRVVDEVHVDVDGMNSRNAKLKIEIDFAT